MEKYVLFDIANKMVLSASADMEPESATILNRQYRAENSSNRWIMNTDSMQAFLASLKGNLAKVLVMSDPANDPRRGHAIRMFTGVLVQWPERMAR